MDDRGREAASLQSGSRVFVWTTRFGRLPLGSFPNPDPASTLPAAWSNSQVGSDDAGWVAEWRLVGEQARRAVICSDDYKPHFGPSLDR